MEISINNNNIHWQLEMMHHLNLKDRNSKLGMNSSKKNIIMVNLRYKIQLKRFLKVQKS